MVGANIVTFPFNRHRGGFEDLDDGSSDLGTNTITFHEGDSVSLLRCKATLELQELQTNTRQGDQNKKNSMGGTMTLMR